MLHKNRGHRPPANVELGFDHGTLRLTVRVGAQFQDFEPFWEFVSGPLNSGTFGPGVLDNTFGPEARFVKAPPPGQRNLPPSAGLQFFGEVQIDGRTRGMTVHLRDLSGASLWSTTLAPQAA